MASVSVGLSDGVCPAVAAAGIEPSALRNLLTGDLMFGNHHSTTRSLTFGTLVLCSVGLFGCPQQETAKPVVPSEPAAPAPAAAPAQDQPLEQRGPLARRTAAPIGTHRLRALVFDRGAGSAAGELLRARVDGQAYLWFHADVVFPRHRFLPGGVVHLVLLHQAVHRTGE